VPLVEQKLTAAAGRRPAARAAPRRLSRRVKSFPTCRASRCGPDERATAWLLTISTSDRAGLLYAIARVLARHGINLHLARCRRWASVWKTPS
jgi:[protein-PII] uridylyltransferase